MIKNNTTMSSFDTVIPKVPSHSVSLALQVISLASEIFSYATGQLLAELIASPSNESRH